MKKVLLVIISFITAVSLFTGCGKPKVEYIKEIVGLNISASSTLDAKEIPWNFHPVYLMDDDPSTAWQEGDEKGYGEGTTITFKFGKVIAFNVIKVVNGYGKFEKYAIENGQLKDIEISAEIAGTPSTRMTAKAALKKVVFIKDPKTNKPAPQEELVKLDRQVRGNSVTITIKSVYPGTKYKDTCLSEIKFGMESEGKVEIYPNKSMDYITKHLEDFKKYKMHNWVFYGLKQTTKNAPECSDLNAFGRNFGGFSMQIFHNGTISRSPATGYDGQGNYKEFLPAANGSFTVEGFDTSGVSILVKSSGGGEETWKISRVLRGDEKWDMMKTEFGTEFNSITELYGRCLFVKISIFSQNGEMDYYTYLSSKFDCGGDCVVGR